MSSGNTKDETNLGIEMPLMDENAVVELDASDRRHLKAIAAFGIISFIASMFVPVFTTYGGFVQFQLVSANLFLGAAFYPIAAIALLFVAKFRKMFGNEKARKGLKAVTWLIWGFLIVDVFSIAVTSFTMMGEADWHLVPTGIFPVLFLAIAAVLVARAYSREAKR